jgi:hypothetical protein
LCSVAQGIGINVQKPFWENQWLARDGRRLQFFSCQLKTVSVFSIHETYHVEICGPVYAYVHFSETYSEIFYAKEGNFHTRVWIHYDERGWNRFIHFCILLTVNPSLIFKNQINLFKPFLALSYLNNKSQELYF